MTGSFSADDIEFMVYVGNIDCEVPDVIVRKLLAACGDVKKWYRVATQVTKSENKIRSLGFCAYVTAEGARRALRLLPGFELGQKKLVAKADSAVMKTLTKDGAVGLFEVDEVGIAVSFSLFCSPSFTSLSIFLGLEDSIVLFVT
jgi:RNA-binding protein 25